MIASLSAVPGIVTAAGVAVAAFQLAQGRSQSRTVFEDDITRVYREMLKPKIVDVLLEPLSSDGREKVEPYYGYLDLCNEQVFLRMQGRIRKRTWQEWSTGMQTNLERPALKDAWKRVRGKLRGEFNEIRTLHVTGYTDPRKWQPRWRRLLRRELPITDATVRRRAARLAQRSHSERKSLPQPV